MRVSVFFFIASLLVISFDKVHSQNKHDKKLQHENVTNLEDILSETSVGSIRRRRRSGSDATEDNAYGTGDDGGTEKALEIRGGRRDDHKQSDKTADEKTAGNTGGDGVKKKQMRDHDQAAGENKQPADNKAQSRPANTRETDATDKSGGKRSGSSSSSAQNREERGGRAQDQKRAGGIKQQPADDKAQRRPANTRETDVADRSGGNRYSSSSEQNHEEKRGGRAQDQKQAAGENKQTAENKAQSRPANTRKTDMADRSGGNRSGMASGRNANNARKNVENEKRVGQVREQKKEKKDPKKTQGDSTGKRRDDKTGRKFRKKLAEMKQDSAQEMGLQPGEFLFAKPPPPALVVEKPKTSIEAQIDNQVMGKTDKDQLRENVNPATSIEAIIQTNDANVNDDPSKRKQRGEEMNKRQEQKYQAPSGTLVNGRFYVPESAESSSTVRKGKAAKDPAAKPLE